MQGLTNLQAAARGFEGEGFFRAKQETRPRERRRITSANMNFPVFAALVAATFYLIIKKDPLDQGSRTSSGERAKQSQAENALPCGFRISCDTIFI
jgi:hypothetical protein